MQNVILVGLGGFLGAVGRYLVGLSIARWSSVAHVPLATLIVNSVGCFVIGFLEGFFERNPLSHPKRHFLVVGLLGGFTTFSAFGLETHGLSRAGSGSMAWLHVGLHMTVALGSVWLGHILGRSLRT